MKQVTYKIGSRAEFMEWVEKIKSGDDYRNHSEILIKVLSSQLLDSDVKDLYHNLKNFLPKKFCCKKYDTVAANGIQYARYAVLGKKIVGGLR